MDNLTDWDNFLDDYIEKHDHIPHTVAILSKNFTRLRQVARAYQRLSQSNYSGWQYMKLDGVEIRATRKQHTIKIKGVRL